MSFCVSQKAVLMSLLQVLPPGSCLESPSTMMDICQQIGPFLSTVLLVSMTAAETKWDRQALTKLYKLALNLLCNPGRLYICELPVPAL